MIEVPNLRTLYSLPSKPQPGERAICTKDDKIYEYNEETKDWDIFEPLTKFEYDKAICKQLPPYDEEDYAKMIDYVNDIFYELRQEDDNVLVLMCNELHYFTVLKTTTWANDIIDSLGEAVADCLRSVGNVVNCEYCDAGFIGFWVNSEDDMYHFRLFDYADGTIEVF